jgi:tetratricopeptide (TPR) repeat protein
MTNEHKGKKHLRLLMVIAVIVAASVTVRIVFLVELERSELGNVLSLDSRFYRDLAADVVSGKALPAGALTFNPLYPLFLIVIFRLFGEGLLAPRVVQLVLGILTIVLVSLAGERLVEGPRRGRPSGEATAVIAAAMAALYSQFLLYEGLLLATTLEIFLLTASFVMALVTDQDLRGERLLTIRSRRIPAWASSLLLGALCGAGALGRPNLFFLLVAALPLWLMVRNRRKRKGLLPALSFAVGACLLLAPPIIYNATRTGQFVPVTAHGGINFYIGNRPGTSGVYQPPDDLRADMRGLIEDARANVEADFGRRATDKEVSNYYFNRAVENIKRDPGGWLRLLGRKLLLFFNGVEVPDVPNVFFCEESCRVLSALFLPFVAIAPLGVAGFIALWRSGRNRSIVAIFLGCAVASVLLFYVNARYRLPVVPLLILCAAFYFSWAARKLSRKRWKQVVVTAMVAVAVFFFVSNRTIVRVNRSAAYTFLGNYYIDVGNEAKAGEAFAEAYRLDPDLVESMINYARVLQKQRESAKAADLYARAYTLMPRFPRLAIEYGSVIENLGQRDTAKRLYREAYSSNRQRERVLACQLLAQSALSEGKRDEAILWVQRALEIVPGDAKLSEMLAWLESSR